MIDYNAFHNYLVELVGMFQRKRSLKGMSDIARKWHCAGLTKEQFFLMKLDKLQPAQVTPQLSRVIRDTIGKSDAKATLRESIGALNEGILANSRISQGSDRTVQITITQPMGVAVAQPIGSPLATKGAQEQTQQAAPVTNKLPLYKPGWIVYRKGGMMHLVTRLLDRDRFTWNYTLMRGDNGQEYIIEENETSSTWAGNEDVRRAKGPETARFVGALERGGYEWRVDNPNGIFIVTGKKKQERSEQVEVFANDLPSGYHGIYALPAYHPSPYRFALRCVSSVDNAEQFMCESTQPPIVRNAVLRQLETIGNGQSCDGIREYREYDLPTLCCAEELREHRVAFVKVNNNGTCYWLARDRDVLRLLSWISFIV